MASWTTASALGMAQPISYLLKERRPLRSQHSRGLQFSGVTFKSVDRTIDPDTGLVQTDQDVSGLATSYEYL